MMFKVHHKETRYFTIMCIISVALYALLAWGLFIAQYLPLMAAMGYVAFFFLLSKIGALLMQGYIKSNCIKVSEKQLPEVYALVKEHAQALELATVPETYILQGNGMLNAFATRLSKRNFVVLYSDVLELAYQEGIEAVSFIIGHELGHIKRDHLTFFKNSFIFPATFVPFLSLAYSRAREHTCDNIGFSVSPHGALKGLLLLGAGKKLYAKISVNQLLIDAAQEQGFATLCAEIISTHPPLCKRIEAMNTQYEEYLASDDACFVSPYIKNTQDTQQL
jgi:Zn-dependent protease with chaperone function